MKYKIKTFGIIILIATITFGLSACGKDEEQPIVLLAPGGVIMINGVLRWGEVKDAEGYNVIIDGRLYRTTTATELTISQEYRSGNIFVEAYAGNLRSPLSHRAIVINNPESSGQSDNKKQVNNPFTEYVPADANIISLVGVLGVNYRDSVINVEPRTTPLVIELENVYAHGEVGRGGNNGADGELGLPVIRVINTGFSPDSLSFPGGFLPRLIISSIGTRNGLIGGAGGNGGRGRSTGDRGRVGGNGAPAIWGADSIEIIGSGKLVLGGGDGGNGGNGGPTSALGYTYTNGGNGGNGGVAVITNEFTVTMNSGGVTAYRLSVGGEGGQRNRLNSTIGGGRDGNPGEDDTRRYINYAGNEISPRGSVTSEPR